MPISPRPSEFKAVEMFNRVVRGERIKKPNKLINHEPLGGPCKIGQKIRIKQSH